jgi:hypothetical protein
MSTLDTAVAELKSLPPAKLEQAAAYIHNLKRIDPGQAKAALDRAFGCLTPAEADDLEQAIEANCEKVDASQW